MTIEEALGWIDGTWSDGLAWKDVKRRIASRTLAAAYRAEKARRKVLEDALRSCEKYDTSKTPEYGERDRRGEKPGPGQRFKTPREIARDTLAAKGADDAN